MAEVDTTGIGDSLRAPPYYVYVLFRLDGSPVYVGKGRGKRWLDHERGRSTNIHLRRIIEKCGSLPRVKTHEGLTNKESAEIEIALIAAIGRQTNGGPLVNLTDGGDGKNGYVTPAETAKKIGDHHRGKPLSDAARLAMSIAGRGRRKSVTHRASIGLAHRGKPKSAAHRQKMIEARARNAEKQAASLRAYFANLSEDERAARSVLISARTKLAMADPVVRAKHRAGIRRRVIANG